MVTFGNNSTSVTRTVKSNEKYPLYFEEHMFQMPVGFVKKGTDLPRRFPRGIGKLIFEQVDLGKEDVRPGSGTAPISSSRCDNIKHYYWVDKKLLK